MNIIIIGNHIAGLTAAETLRKGDQRCAITVISKEDVPPYSRCLIGNIISGKKRVDDILFKPRDFYANYAIQTMFGAEVVKILTAPKEIQLATNAKVSYDALIIATGGSPSLPAIPGIQKRGVFGFRTLTDAETIKAYCQQTETAVVIGGGLIGVKAAVALHESGKQVKVLVSSATILSQIIAAEEAEIFEDYLHSLGIQILKNTSPAEILGQETVAGAQTKNGETIACQMVIVGKGVDANKTIVEGTTIETDKGIIIDDHCRTNVADVYAAGDVTQSKDSVRRAKRANALWPLAMEEGRVAAENILGKDSVLRERTSMNALTIGDLALISCGLTGVREPVEGIEKVIIKGKANRELKKFLLKDNVLVGFALIGDVSQAGVLTTLVRKGVNVGKVKDQLCAGKYDFASVLPAMLENKGQFPEPEFTDVFNFIKR